MISVLAVGAPRAARAVTIVDCGDGAVQTYPAFGTDPLGVQSCQVQSNFAAGPMIDAAQAGLPGMPPNAVTVSAELFCHPAQGGLTAFAYTEFPSVPPPTGETEYYVVGGWCENFAEQFCCAILEDFPGEVSGIGIIGTADADRLHLTWSAFQTLEPLGDDLVGGLWGGSGDDGLTGSFYAITPGGPTYLDTLYGGPDSDELYGLTGNDILMGNGGRDAIVGGRGRDAINGGEGDDLLVGDEQLFGGYNEADVIAAGSGDDEVCTGNSTNGFTGGPAGWYLACETVGMGLLGDPDVVYGADGDDIIEGTTDPDKLFGGDGADHLSGNGGNDKFEAGLGSDTIEAGSGDDIVCFYGSGDSVTTFGGDDEIYSNAGATWSGVAAGAGLDTCAGTYSPSFGCDVDMTTFPLCPVL